MYRNMSCYNLTEGHNGITQASEAHQVSSQSINNNHDYYTSHREITIFFQIFNYRLHVGKQPLRVQISRTNGANI